MEQSGTAGQETVAEVRVLLLHTPRVLLPDGQQHGLPPNDAALLAVLALDGPTPRAKLAALLWPEVDDDKARNNLRQRLFRWRRLTGYDLVVQGQVLALAPGVAHDLSGTEDALLRDVAALGGDLLGAADYGGQSDLAHWVAATRQRWRATRRDALAGIAARLEAASRVAEALPYAERLAREEPLLEHAQRQLMRLHYRRGDRGAALAAYEGLREALDRMLGETPSPETQQLASLIEASIDLPTAAPPPTPLGMLHPPLLVGRAPEWQAMAAAWARGTPLLLLGEPGIGKSRLLTDFAQAHGVHHRVLTRPGDAAVPYALLARLVRALWLDDGVGTPSPRPALPAWARSELAHIVPEFGTPPPGPVVTVRLRRAVEQALSLAVTEAVLIDDLQFADEASLELLTTGLFEQAGLRWLLSARRNELPTPLTAWLQRAAAELAIVTLGPLDPDAVGQLLTALAEDEPLLLCLGPELHRHTGGHPLLVLQTMIEWLRRGRRPIGPGQALPFPADVRRLIEQRLASLSPEALKLAQVAALAGGDFEVELAAAIVERHPLDLMPAWRELEQVHVLDERAFVHDLLRECCRDATPRPIRGWLHGRIAQWLASERPGSAPATVARHWHEAGEIAKAALGFMRAAEQARAAGRHAEERAWLRQAADGYAQVGRQPERFEALRQLVIVTREVASPAPALELAGELLDGAVTDRERGIARKELGVCHMHMMRYDLAEALQSEAVTLLTRAGDADECGHAAYLHAMTTARSAGPAQAAARLEALLPWALGQKDEALRQCFYIDLGTLLDQSDQRLRARSYFLPAIDYFQQRQQPAELAAARLMLGRSMQHTGELVQALVQIEEAVKLRDELSDGAGGQGIELLNFGRVLCEAGQYGRALDLLEPLVQRLTDLGIPVVCAATRHVIARVHVHLGQHARASQAMAPEPEGLPPFQQATGLWTQALLVQDSPQRRADLLARAMACFDGEGRDLPFVRLPIQFDHLAAAGGAAAIETCRALLDECRRRELVAARLLGQVRLVQMLGGKGGHGDEAMDWIVVTQDELATSSPIGAYLPELHWICHQVALGAGADELARRCLMVARRWIVDTVLPGVPEPFRHGFLSRNPINRRVLTASESLVR